MSARLPLEGIRVLTFENFGAGPFGSMYLADLGAWVWGRMKDKAATMWLPNDGLVGPLLPSIRHHLVAGTLSARPALVIDGLLGIGLNRPLGTEWISLIECVNAAGVKVLAVDVPSGLNAETGQPEGTAIRAAARPDASHSTSRRWGQP